jgi:hypothetical protein
MTLNQSPSQNYIIQLQISKENWQLATPSEQLEGKKSTATLWRSKNFFIQPVNTKLCFMTKIGTFLYSLPDMLATVSIFFSSYIWMPIFFCKWREEQLTHYIAHPFCIPSFSLFEHNWSHVVNASFCYIQSSDEMFCHHRICKETSLIHTYNTAQTFTHLH